MTTEHVKYRAVLLLGAPGVGKGTQGGILGRIPGFFHLACGDVFRSIDIHSPSGREIYRYSSAGELVPDELTIYSWRKELEAHVALSSYKPREDLLVLDGIPRSVQQAEILQDHVEILKVVHLVCSDEKAMIHRIKRRAIRENRADDASEEVIRRRFEIYNNESAPVLAFYPNEIVSQVDALSSPATVLCRILEFLIPAQNDHFAHEVESMHGAPLEGETSPVAR